jgi:hypothetical protein
VSKVKKTSVLTGVRNVAAARKGARRVIGSPTGKAAPAVKKAAGKTAGKAAKPAKKAVAGASRRPVGGIRKVTGKAAKPASKTAKKAAQKAAKPARKVAKQAGRKAAPKKAAAKGRKVFLTVTKGAGGRTGRLEPIVRFAIKELDPIRKCGPDTSVQFLYRVDESVEGKTTPHLVFFDRHGWYCEHGRTCPAVAPARKHNGHIARVS